METSQSEGTNGHVLDRDSEQYQGFQKWALQNYGDSGKTKTVTRKKYDRIVQTLLEADENISAENQKFRFWVKAKGFVLGEEKLLYIPTKLSSIPQGGADGKDYKRVAIVEDFFDIIYGVHVEMEGRGGKHAGQKRTYRAIAETYSFLPREAVTRFLMSCADCQRRMHGGQVGNNNENNNTVQNNHPNIDFSMPITTTYLNHIRNRGLLCNTVDPDFAFDPKYGDAMSSGDSDLSRSPSPATNEASPSPRPPDLKQEESFDGSRTSTPINLSRSSPAPSKTSMAPKNGDLPLSLKLEQKVDDKIVLDGTKGHPERKRRASDELSLDDSSTKASEAEDLGKEDDEDDDNEEEFEKLPAGHGFDPERLKSFNMFVRLFVDENLDRMVPISKQPKDKIQAILDACDRQFPEFHERSRKRVRTYLKSCRRMRRSKEANGWEPLRPTPPHLTSAAAESLLAQACENESENAKRMRMGLEPLPAGLMSSQRERERADQAAAASQAQPHTPSQPAQPTHPPQLERQQPTPSLLSEFMRQPPPHAFRPPHEMPPFFPATNGLFRPGFPAAYPAHHPSPVLTASALTGQVQNGPTDLSVKKGSGPPTTQQSSNKNQLNPTEIATIKQLIAGYRESASFLYRSADELEQLLMQQN